ncbi:MAG: YwiC-like family protein [Acidimicrobiia bacterium]|nr:YwiC-like family protein [Acidimicrobiia bacterium]
MTSPTRLVADSTPAPPAESEARPRSTLRAVALPAEHGGWSLTLEPAILGMLVAPSGAGLVLGLAALVAFVARTPLKVILVDSRRGRRLARTRLAALVLGVEAGAIVCLLVGAVLFAHGDFWVPLALAAPLFALELWFDMRSHGRRLLPELAGAIGMGSVAASIVLAGGGSPTAAAGAWLVIAARVVASLPFVRYQVSRAKVRSGHIARQDLAQAGAVAAAGAGFLAGWLPVMAALPLVALAAVQACLARAPAPRAAVIGVEQICFGLVVAVSAGLAIPAS